MLHEAKPTRAQRGGVVGRDAQPGAPRLPSGPDHGDVPQKKGRGGAALIVQTGKVAGALCGATQRGI
eukprot:scaffold8721_cov80-Phaeocystis_antarctica.AAC.11